MTEKTKELYTEFMGKRPKHVKALVCMGMLNYQPIEGNDELIIRRTWRWWNPLVWVFILVAIIALLVILVVAAPFLAFSITYRYTKQLALPRVVNYIAIDNKNK